MFDCSIQTSKTIEKRYKEKANGVKIRSKGKWYELGEKSSKFFSLPRKITYFAKSSSNSSL